MGRFAWLFVTPVFVFGTLSGCKPKVDCDKLETRLISCLKDNTRTLNPSGCPEDVPECKEIREKLTADYARLVDKEIVGPCRAASGRDSRAARINECLDRKECKEVHACLKEASR